MISYTSPRSFLEALRPKYRGRSQFDDEVQFTGYDKSSAQRTPGTLGRFQHRLSPLD